MLAAVILPASGALANSLRELGFPDGFVLRGPRAEVEAFFPLPANPSRVELALEIQPSPMLDAYSSVVVYIGESPLIALPLKDGPRIERIAIPPALARGEFLQVRIVADQALRRDDLCFDNDSPGVYTRIGADTRLEFGAEGTEGVGTVWRRLAGRVPMSLPAPPSLPDLEAAVTLATALYNRGAEPVMVGPNDPSALIRIGRANTPLALEPVQGAPAGTWRLRIADSSAARALVAAAPMMRTMDSVVARGEAGSVSIPASAESVAFSEIGIRPQQVAIYSAGTLTFELPFDRLPPGRHPVALQLFGRGPATPQDEALAVSLSVGGRLLWSNTYRGVVELDGVQVALPPDLLRHRMTVTLRLARLGSRRACGSDDALPFQLRETSRVLLADGYAGASDFGGFAVNGERPALVRVDIPPSDAVAAVPLLGRLLNGAAARPQAIELASGASLSRPFILLSRAAPADIAGAGLLRPDLGRVVLDDQRNGARVEVSPAAGMTLVQLVNAGNVPGLWVSPGAEASLRDPAGLTLGNVAVFDGQIRPVVFDTRRPTVAVEEARFTTETTLLDRWRNELFILAWVLIILLAVVAVVRLRRRRG
jgi:hypothetical protein